MKKIIVGILAVLIILNSAYGIYLANSEGGLADAWLFLISAVLFIIAGIGLLMNKRWSVWLYWIALIVAIVNAFMAGSLRAMDFDVILFVIEIIVGIFFVMAVGKSSSNSIQQPVQTPGQM